MKKKNCITIGLVGTSEDTPVLECINSILNQTYKPIELIITMVGDSKRIFNNIYCAIKSADIKNIVGIKYKFFNEDEPLVNHFEYIRNNSNGEYICFMRMQDSLYDTETLQAGIDVLNLQGEYNAYMFSTLVYEDDTFSDMEVSCGEDELPKQTDVSFIFKNNKRFLFCEYENETFEDIVWNMWTHSLNCMCDRILCRNIKNRTKNEGMVVEESMIIKPEQYKDTNVFEESAN